MGTTGAPGGVIPATLAAATATAVDAVVVGLASLLRWAATANAAAISAVRYGLGGGGADIGGALCSRAYGADIHTTNTRTGHIIAGKR
jgi:hypothetical protein